MKSYFPDVFVLDSLALPSRALRTGLLGFSWDMFQRRQPHSGGKKGMTGRKVLHNRSQPLSRAPDGKVLPAPGSLVSADAPCDGGGGAGSWEWIQCMEEPGSLEMTEQPDHP